MTKKRRLPGVVLALATLTALTLVAATPATGKAPPTAKNVIVMIADGWGYNHIEAASDWQYGAPGRQQFNRFPVRLGMSTYMEYPAGDPCAGLGYDPFAAAASFDYVMTCATDSAAAATAMATGFKTLDGAIGVDTSGAPLLNLVEHAEHLGMATGLVTSVELSHATPAGFVAHNVSRSNYEEIAMEMVYDSALDVVMGAGHPWFDNDGLPLASPNTFKYVGGTATWDDLVAGLAGGDADGDGVADPWTLITDRAEFRALGSGPTPDRVFGVAEAYWTLQQGRSGDGQADPFKVRKTKTVPNLKEMTRAALNVLDNDPDGFFLMVEGGAVDWASHGNYNPNQSGRMIEEMVDFDRAVRVVIDWVRKHSNWKETVLIVTGDHETGCLTGPGSDPLFTSIVNYGRRTLPGMEWHSPDHTNSLIPLFAKGVGSKMLIKYADEWDPARGWYLDNTELAKMLFAVLG